MNTDIFNGLPFNESYVSLLDVTSDAASWLPVFIQPDRPIIYASGGVFYGKLTRSVAVTIAAPDPLHGIVERRLPSATSRPWVIPYVPPTAPPSNAGFQALSVPDPRRGTSTPLYGPFKPFIIPPFLGWTPTFIQPFRPILRSPGTDHVKDVWRFPEAVSADKWLVPLPQPSRVVSYAPGTTFATSPADLIFADKWQPVLFQPARPIVYAKGTDTVLSRELITADKWMPTWNQPSRQIVRAAGTHFVIGPIMPFDLLVPLSQATVSITGGTSLTSTAFGRMHVCTGTSANYTVTLPSPTGNSGDFIGFTMGSGLTKLVTIAQNASEKIDGANSRVMWANEVAILMSDGTNWIKIYGKSLPMMCTMYQGSGGTSLPAGFTVVPMNTMLIDNTGLMADTTNGRINIVRAGNYNFFGIITAGAVGTSGSFQVYIEWNSTANAQSSSMYSVPSGTGINATCTASGSATAGTYVDIVANNSTGSTTNTNASFASGLNNVSASEIITW